MVLIKPNTAILVSLNQGALGGWCVGICLKENVKTNDTSCFPQCEVMRFLLSPAFQNPQARYPMNDIVKALSVCSLHKSHSVN